MALMAKLQELHGDVEVLMDCPRCGHSAAVTTVVAEPVTVKLQQVEQHDPQGQLVPGDGL